MSASLSRRRRVRQPRGFTLVELMISLVMGLIIALAAVGLARTATTTFYEQARVSGVEANVRAASERFRSDLSRVSYMSTPNIHFDPKLAKVPGGGGAPYRIPALQNLQGISVLPATTMRAHALSAANSITPHEVFIAGNLTTDDVYRGQFMASGAGCGGGGGAQIRLSALADPAVRRLFNGETTSAKRKEMTQLAFTPGDLMSPPPLLPVTYAVQVMDMRGCFHYMTICGVDEVTTQPESVMLNLAGEPTRGLLTPEDTLGDVCGARVMEEVAIAPIQRVKWSLETETDVRRLDPSLDVAGEKFNLQRQVLAADGVTTVGPAEVVAEYAVDLKLGLLVDSSTPGLPGTTNIDLEGTDADFAKWTGPATSSLPNIGPQRVRSIRYRLAFRTTFPDRTADLPMPSGPPYISRYWMGANKYARVRTVISEVALLNQGKAVY